MPRRAKIICTIGPSSRSPATLAALVDAGMNVARLNFSHGDHGQHAETLDAIRAAAGSDRHVAVLQDLQGPKIRIGRLPGGSRELKIGERLTLTGQVPRPGDIEVSLANLHRDVAVGDTVLLDDGNLAARVVEIDGERVHIEVTHGGTLKDNKGLNLPGSVLSVPPLSAKDLTDLEFGLAAGVDMVAMSFVQRASDIAALKSAMQRFGRRVPIIAKIEKPQAVDALDAIMVARGDLGVELPPEEVPAIQKRIIRRCNELGVPVITATQMLESMIDNPRPTRAEASDVANAVLDGTDAVMLSGETASGDFPLEAVRMMDKIVRMTEAEAEFDWDRLRRNPERTYPPEQAIGYAACHAAEMVKARAIVCLTQSGSTARVASAYRPRVPIVALSQSAATCRQLALVWGVEAHVSEDFADNADVTIEKLIKRARAANLASPGDRLVFTSGLPFAARRATNTLRIETVDRG